jgi:hypothetical protein
MNFRDWLINEMYRDDSFYHKEKTLKRLYEVPNIVISDRPDLDLDGFTWKYKNVSLDVEIISSEQYVNSIYNKLSAEEFEKDLFDENFGAIPHELLEAKLTKIIMWRKFDLIESKFLVQFYKELPFIERIFSINGNQPFDNEEIFNNEKIYSNIAGHVHEIIEKSTTGYVNWLNYVYDKISN